MMIWISAERPICKSYVINLTEGVGIVEIPALFKARHYVKKEYHTVVIF